MVDDPQRYDVGDLGDPAADFFAVTPSDVTDFTTPVRGLYVAGAGTITAISPQGNAVLFTGVPAGAVLPIRCTRVNSTGTTATGLVGLI